MQNTPMVIIVLILLLLPVCMCQNETNTSGAEDTAVTGITAESPSVCDFDGDGKADTYTFITENNEKQVWAELTVNLSDGKAYKAKIFDAPCHAEYSGDADLDGDGVAELYLLINTLGNGGAGTHIAYMLLYDGNGGFTETVIEPQEFTLAFADNYRFELTAKATGYQSGLMDIPNIDDAHRAMWDRSGKPLAAKGGIDGIYGFMLKHGRLTVFQYAWGIAHADYIGDAVTVYKLSGGKLEIESQSYQYPGNR